MIFDAYLQEFKPHTSFSTQSFFFLYDVLLNDISQQHAFPIYAARIKEAVLNGVSLEDEKRDRFNKIEQVSFSTLACQISFWNISTSKACAKDLYLD